MATLDQQVSEFYVEQRQALYRQILFLGLGQAEAQELTQEAFLALYRALRSGESVESWRAWLFRVARNLALNRMKAAKRSESIDSAPRDFRGHSLDPERRAVLSERRARLSEAIAALSQKQRECLHLRAQGFRYREIGEILGIRVPTVGEFLRRAVDHLRKAGL